MDKKKKSMILKVIIVVLICTNAFLLLESNKEKKIIEEYLDKYYSQVLFKEDTLLELQEEIHDAMITIDEDNTKEDDNVKFSVYQNQYNDYLTQKMKKNLAENKLLPNINLIKYGIDNNIESFSIENVKYRKKGKNIYNIKYDLVLKDNLNKDKSVKYDETYTLVKDEDIMKIDYIGKTIGN